jgi:hypothetical protein
MMKQSWRKILCSALILGMLVALTNSFAFAIEGEQVSLWAAEEVKRAEMRSLIPEELAEAFLQEPMTREEFAGVIIALWKEKTNQEISVEGESPFLDTDDREVIQAWKLGVVNGVGQDLYQPMGTLNRQTAATMMSRLYEKFMESSMAYSDVNQFMDHQEIDGWAQAPVYFMTSRNIIKGVGEQRFDPRGTLTREQAVILALRMLEELFRSNSAYAPSVSYFSGMEIQSMEDLKEVLVYAQYHLLPSISLTMDSRIKDQIDRYGADILLHTEIKSLSYSYGPRTRQFKAFLDYSRGAQVISLTLNPELDSSRATQEAHEIHGRLKEILGEILKPGMKAYEREKAIHDYVVKNHSYDQRAELNPEKYADSYSLAGLLYNGTGVCQGYAELFCALSLNANLYCDIVYGTASGGGHAWNMIGIYGEYYHVDPTWNDPVPDRGSRVSYQYYNVNDEKMAKDHQWDRTKYPVCDYVTYLGNPR